MVVADTGPLNYLIWIDAADLLPLLYKGVLIPPAVLEELKHSRAPEKVREWLSLPPAWLAVKQPFITANKTSALGKGESEAIQLALQTSALLLLMDDRAGVCAASALNLPTTGTLGVLVRAAQGKLIDLTDVLAKLKETNFRASDKLLATILERHREQSS